MEIDLKTQNPKLQTESVRGFLGGLNTFQDQSVIKDSELTEAKNIILTVDGIEPRYGTENYGDDGDGDTKVYWGGGFYKSDGTKQLLRISATGTTGTGRLRKYDSGTGEWDAIDSTVFDSVNTDAVQAINTLFFFNGTENLRSYDGTTITSYSALSTPANLTVVPHGTGATTTYSYRVTAFNDQGETLAVAAATTTTGAATLSTTNFNRLDWDNVTGATGYNIYGRKSTGVGHTYMATVYGQTTSTYDDVGDYSSTNPTGATPTTTKVPEENTSGGIKGSMACFAVSRIFVAGHPDNPSRLYWSGLGSEVDNFSGAPEGGGYVDVFKNDGTQIRGIIAFQGGVIVGKDNAIFKFSFTSEGFPQLEEITRSFGVISHRSMKHVENDIIFAAKKDGRLAFYSLGNQENYAASVLRTNELSIKVASELESVNLANISKSAAFYYRNIYGCAIGTTSSTVNDRIWCLDTRFGAWVYWEGLNPNSFFTYNDTDGTEYIFYGNDNTGYVTKMFLTDRNDNGAAISVLWATKSFDQDSFYAYKQYYKPTFQFKNINKSGAISGDIVVDGAITEKSFSVTNIITGGLGFGAMLFGQPLFGNATGGTPSEGEPADQLVEIYTPRLLGRSIKYSFRTSTIDLTFKFLSLKHSYQVMEGRRLPQSSRIY
jgi:hypothetical protein